MATQPYPWFPTAVRAVLEACKSVPDCTVCVKLHPNDFPLDLYRTMVRETGADNVQLFETDFYELLAACDVSIERFVHRRVRSDRPRPQDNLHQFFQRAG